MRNESEIYLDNFGRVITISLNRCDETVLCERKGHDIISRYRSLAMQKGNQ